MTGIRQEARRADALHTGRQPLGLSSRNGIGGHRHRVCLTGNPAIALNALARQPRPMPRIERSDCDVPHPQGVSRPALSAKAGRYCARLVERAFRWARRISGRLGWSATEWARCSEPEAGEALSVAMSVLRPPVEVMLARSVHRRAVRFGAFGRRACTSRSGTGTGWWRSPRFAAVSAVTAWRRSHWRCSLRSPTPVATLPSRVVLDGELVIWGDGALDFPALLQRMASRGPKARQLRAARPANSRGVRHPRRRRRRPASKSRCGQGAVSCNDLLADAHPSLVLSPATTDRELAQRVARSSTPLPMSASKASSPRVSLRPYRGGARDWLKYRYRDTLDVVVGAVTGSLTAS